MEELVDILAQKKLGCDDILYIDPSSDPSTWCLYGILSSAKPSLRPSAPPRVLRAGQVTQIPTVPFGFDSSDPNQWRKTLQIPTSGCELFGEQTKKPSARSLPDVGRTVGMVMTISDDSFSGTSRTTAPL